MAIVPASFRLKGGSTPTTMYGDGRILVFAKERKRKMVPLSKIGPHRQKLKALRKGWR
jgi:hypothetical protein